MLPKELPVVLPPPANPVDAPAFHDWGNITERFGLVLPSDYTAFVQAYGSGIVSDFLTVFNPFSANSNINVDAMFSRLSSLRELRMLDPEELPYPLFFEPGGLLPWGESVDGDIYCWITDNEISTFWRVVVCLRSGGSELCESNMTTFLLDGLRGQGSDAVFPPDFAAQAKFAPAS
jgi:hypothetical protein